MAIQNDQEKDQPSKRKLCLGVKKPSKTINYDVIDLTLDWFFKTVFVLIQFFECVMFGIGLFLGAK
jgi:hypothetical protein